MSVRVVEESIRLRRGTSAEWAATSSVLGKGEPGYETDTGVLKVGDGVSTWGELNGFITDVPIDDLARRGSQGRTDLGLGTAAVQPASAFDTAGAAATAQSAAIATAATDATTKVATEATARAAAITALTAGSPSQLDTFLEVYNRFLADESTTGGLTTLVGALRSVTDATFRAALIAFLTDSYAPLETPDTGWYDISKVLDSSVAVHTVIVRRVGRRVTMLFNADDGGGSLGATGGRSVPNGFRPTTSPLGGGVIVAPIGDDGGGDIGGQIALSSLDLSGDFVFGNAGLSNDTGLGRLEYDTDDAWLTTFPGVHLT